ncbi:MAG: cyanophycin synthetase [bacterium]|nr:cyanophycin synthetase [bacterium]
MKHVHFLGIGGSGTSAAAAIAQAQGYKISGCDKDPQADFLKFFPKEQIFIEHSPKHLKGVNILATTPAVFSLDPHNPELLEAQKRGLEVLTWQEFMGKYLEKDKFVIAICGTHGKTTTTAMSSLLLEEAKFDPTVELGSVIPQWGTNYRIGKGKPVLSGVEGYFITEADEFSDNFLASHPDITILTSVEMDHPEFFKDFTDYKKSFQKFLSQTKKTIIANLANSGVKEVLASHSSSGNTKIIDYSDKLIDFPLQVLGQFNILNASAVYQLGLALGINPEIIKKSLSSYQGTGRRFEYLGKVGKTEIYSDFGHHPTEIKLTIKAAREKFSDKKILLVFQPHMFSRTKALFTDFVKVLSNVPVDKTYLLDIYPSREIDTGLVSSQELVEAVNKPNFRYLEKEKIKETLHHEASDYDIIIFMGAGDIDKIARGFVNQ